MVPTGNKAKRLFLVSHTTKTIHHHHQLVHISLYGLKYCQKLWHVSLSNSWLGLGSCLFRILKIGLGLSKVIYAKFYHEATDLESGGKLKTRN